MSRGAAPDEGIAYVFLGDLLGGRPSQPSLYDDDGRVNYDRACGEPRRLEYGLDWLTQGLKGDTVAFLCSEKIRSIVIAV